VEAIQGAIGDLVYKTYNHREIVARMPDRTGIVQTASQIAQQDKFRLATLYGKSVLADETTKQLYDDAAARKGLVAGFAVAVADFLNPPVIREVDLSEYTGKVGDTIDIRATDDVEVKGVGLTILDQGGAKVEEGAAAWNAATATWRYTTTAALAQGQSATIEVTATDIPGHKGTRTATK
jgi:hypothetical protein